jgi:hypothetical protein
LWVDREALGRTVAQGDVDTVVLARLAGGPSAPDRGREGEPVVLDTRLEPTFSAQARLRAIAAHATVRGLEGSAELAAVAVHHGRHLCDSAALGLCERFLSTLGAEDRNAIEAEVGSALLERGRLRSFRVSGRRAFQIVAQAAGRRLVLAAATGAKAAIMGAAGLPARILVSSLTPEGAAGATHRLEAIALTSD